MLHMRLIILFVFVRCPCITVTLFSKAMHYNLFNIIIIVNIFFIFFMHPVVKIPEVKNIQLKTNAKMARGLDLSQCWYY